MAGPVRAADDLEAGLRASAPPERAAHEQRYLKSDLEHLGATVWQIRREVESFAEQHPALSHAEPVQLVDALWAKPAHERRMAAVLMLEAYPELVEPSDLPLLERLVRESKTWAFVDGLGHRADRRRLKSHNHADPTRGFAFRWVSGAARLRRIRVVAGARPSRRAGGATACTGGPSRTHPERPLARQASGALGRR